MPIGNGGIIGPANVPTITTASGVWSLREQQQAQGRGAWPLAIAPDPYFEYTTLLLPGNGTNGANNNTFLDGSTNNFTITRNGNTTQGTFSPFSQTGWGNYFDGNGDYLQTPNNAAFNLSSGSFTIEAWVYRTNPTTSDYVFWSGTATGSNSGLNFWISNGNLLYIDNGVTGTTGYGSVTGNQWIHVALIRDGGNSYLYVNGVCANPSTPVTQAIGTGGIGLIGCAGVTTQGNFDGYISNFRIIKGQALVTGGANFTPPTGPVNATQVGWNGSTTALTGTCSIVTCQSNRFIDNSTANSGSGFPITVNGGASVVAFSPFNPTLPWSAATNGGSGYFDGNADWINPNTTSANLALGSGDFTIEFWLYTPRGATRQYICDFRNNGSTGTISPQTAPALIWGDDGADGNGNWFRYLALSNGSIVANADLLGVTLSTLSNQWNHIAIVRSSGTVYGYLNGVRKNSVADSTNYNVNCSVSVASYLNGAISLYLGYISNFRVVKGTAVYTGTNYTVPTAPLTAITNTSLLLNYTNAGIYDATSKNDLETLDNTVNGVRISTAQSQFGGSSIYFDGTGTDYLWIQADQPIQRFGTAPFTIELWIRLAATGSARGLVAKGTSTTGWLVSLNTSNQVVFTYGTSTITSTGTISANNWTYIAVVREGTGANQTKIYIGGVNDGTGTVSTDFTQTSSMYIGADRTGGSLFSGYIQDVRITNGYARTVTTIPTTAFPVI